MRLRTPLATALLALTAMACANGRAVGATAPVASEAVVGTWTMVAENGQALPSDPSAPYGCCITLAGTLAFTATTYDLRTSHRNKVNGMLFDNSEQGTWTRDGRTIRFTRTGGGGAGYPYLLAPGELSADGRTLTLLYGDEGPGSDQTRGVFRRQE